MILRTLLATKAAAGVGAGVIVLSGGTAAAAYAGLLPDNLQNVAHHSIGAPAATGSTVADPTESADATDSGAPSDSASASDSASGSASASPVGPDATGPAAFGLCNAYLHGGLSTNSVAYQNLLKAAGTGTISAYCATVAHPGNRPSGAPSHPSGKPSSHPGGRPSDLPTVVPTDHPTGAPSDLPGGKPTSLPTP